MWKTKFSNELKPEGPLHAPEPRLVSHMSMLTQPYVHANE